MDLNDITARARLIVSMIVADDVITSEEREFLHRTLERMGLSTDDMSAILDHVAEEDAEDFIAGLDRITSLDILNDLAHAALADGHLDEDERAYIDRMASLMTLDAMDVQEAIDRARAGH